MEESRIEQVPEEPSEPPAEPIQTPADDSTELDETALLQRLAAVSEHRKAKALAAVNKALEEEGCILTIVPARISIVTREEAGLPGANHGQ